MSNAAVRVRGLGKKYHLGSRERGYKTLRDSLTSAVTAPWRRFRELSGHRKEHESFWALREVDFEVAPGEVVGIIGHNGAGKSTLLKILSQITEPTTGEIALRGRVGSLWEVGTGCHPELTGRDNIVLNGAILGMSRAEVKRKFDEIVDFSGVEQFLDTPVKHYSSGMHVRLAFSVAAHLEPEILIVDEVLAVGDAEFQKKCLGKMDAVARSGRTILFVSHNLAAIESLCTTALLFKNGHLFAAGDVLETVSQYHSQGSSVTSSDVDLSTHSGRPAGRETLLRRLYLADQSGKQLPGITLGGDAYISFALKLSVPVSNLSLLATVLTWRGEPLFSLNSRYQGDLPAEMHGDVTIACHVRNCRLLPGQYVLRVVVRSHWKTLDEITEGLTLNVLASDVFGTGGLPTSSAGGHFLPEVIWSCIPSRCKSNAF